MLLILTNYNSSSMKKFLLLCAAICTGLIGSAQLDQIVVETFDSWANADYAPAPGLVTYRVFAELQDPTDEVSAIFATDGCHTLDVTTTTNFYNNIAFGGQNPSSINPALFPVFADLQADTYMSIGAIVSTDPQASDVNIIEAPVPGGKFANTLNGAGEDLNLIDGAVFVPGGVLGTGPDNRVFLGQFTTDGELGFALNLQVFDEGDGVNGNMFYVHTLGCYGNGVPNDVEFNIPSLVYPLDGAEGCTDPSACNFDADASDDDGSCEYLSCCEASAGTLTADDAVVCEQDGGNISASAGDAPGVPVGYDVLYVLTSGAELVIEDVSDAASFSGLAAGEYTIHTLVYDPSTLDLSIVEFGVTTGVDVNGLLAQGGGTICAALDVAGAGFTVEACAEGCTDANACNFDPLAVIDNGNCVVVAAGEVTGEGEACAGDGNADNIEFFYDSVGSEGTSTAWVVTTTGLEILNIIPSVPGTSDQVSIDFDSFDAGQYLVWYLTFTEISGAEIGANAADLDGCYALSNDQSVFVSAAGCLNPDAVNYDPSACGDDGSCEFEVIPGCTDNTACNFDGNATEDDGSCEYLSCCEADAGSLEADAAEACLQDGGSISASHNADPFVPAGYDAIYVLTSGAGLVIEDVNGSPAFAGLAEGDYTIHTLVYDASTLDLGIVEFGVTTGFDVNGLLAQGGGTICASLDVAGAPVSVVDCPCEANAGTLVADASEVCVADGGNISASVDVAPVVPADYEVLYVLTSGAGLVIEDVNAAPSFTGLAEGDYTIHTLVYDPSTLDLGIVEFGVTTGFDVNGLLQQGGGDICASLDVAGASVSVVVCEVPCEAAAGSLVADANEVCVADGGNISASVDVAPVVPADYEVLYVLTSGAGLVIEDVNAAPSFSGLAEGDYTIHTLVYDPSTLDLGIVEFGVTTGFDVNGLLQQGGGDICASLDVAGASVSVVVCEVPCEAAAGSLVSDDAVVCAQDGGNISATQGDAPVVPAGYSVLYVLTEGDGLVIQNVNAEPAFGGLTAGSYTIHTLVYDPSTLDLGIVEFGVTTGFDVNGLLQQGGGDICAALDVAGASFTVETCEEGCTDETACNYNPDVIFDDGSCEFAEGGEGFTGDYAPANWTVDLGGGDGSVDIDEISMTVVGNDNEQVGILTQATIVVAASGEFTFDWDYVSGDIADPGVPDGPEFDPAFYINGVAVQLTDDLGPNNQSGSESFFANAGDVIGFGINATDGLFGAGTLNVTNFTYPGDCGCMIECPEDVTVECDEDISADVLGVPTGMGNCDFGVEVSDEVIEEGDCLTIIERTFLIFEGDEESECVQTITIVDTTAPEFIDFPEDVLVECIEDVPAPEMVSAEDNCDMDIVVEMFESQTGEPETECIATTAFAPGDDWAVWLPTLEVLGLTATDDFVPSGDGLTFTQYADGTAHLFGQVENNTDPSQKWEVSIWLENKRDWDEWSGLGRSYKDSFGFAEAGGDLWETWDYYEMVNGFSMLTGVDALAGNVLYLEHMPSNFYHGFQCGEAANDRNANFGMSGWFTFYGQFNGEFIEGHGDVNIDKECTPIDNPDDCPNSTEFTYFYRAEDACANVAMDSYQVIVNDTTAPVFTVVPEDVTVECDAIPAVFEGVEAEDNCDCGVEVLEYLGEILVEGGNDCEYQLQRIWAAEDCCDNRTEYTQTITVVDTTPPVFTVIPEDATIECDQEIPGDLAQGEDNCQEVSVSFEEEIIEGDCPQEYTIIRTHTLDDGCGNTATAEQTINVVDTTAPVFDEYEVEIAVECTEVENVSVTAQDNCGEVTLTFEDVIQSGGCLGVIYRVYTAVDECGNESTAEQFITVEDTTPPVIENPEDMTVECDDVPEAPGADGINIFDNCEFFATSDEVTVEFSEEIVEGDCADNYTIIWTWVATDYCENVSEASTTITVQDTTDPVFVQVPEDITVECDEEIPGCDIESVVAEDNCDMDVTIECEDQIVDGDCPAEYTIQRMYRAFDNCGNMAMYVQNINVVDTTAPVITPIDDITVECDQAIPMPEVTATDNCSDVEVEMTSEEVVEGECPQESTIVQTYVATDACGNVSEEFVLNINVVDTTAPVFDEFSVEIDVPCDDIDSQLLTAQDNCGAVTIDWTDTFVSGGCEGTIIRDYTATDECGNVAEAQQILHLIDEVAPEFTVFPADETVECDMIPEVATGAEATDNCDEDVEIEYLGEEIIEGDCPQSYTIIRTWVAIDNCDNETEQSQTITVQDTTAPEIIESPLDMTYECDEEIPACNIDGVVAEDNCGMVTVECSEEQFDGDCPQEYSLVRTFTVSDECGNTSTAQQTISVVDTTAPVVTPMDDITIECDEEIPAAMAEATDNCGDTTMDVSEEIIAGDCPQAYTLVRTYTATDECGNVSEPFVQNINVVDTTAPVFDEFEVEIDVPCDEVDVPFLTATDNCDEDVQIDFEDTFVSGGCEGTIIRDYIATDDCGNTAEAQQIIHLIDEEAPVFVEGPEDVTVECDNIPEVGEVGGQDGEPITGAGAFVRSNASLWSANENEHIIAMNALYGEDNWSDLRFEDVDADDLLANHSFIYLEGGDMGATAMATFLSNNLPAIENWVSNGGHLLINAAPNVGGDINLGFGGVSLNVDQFTDFGEASDAAHPIFAGGIATSYEGNWLGHSIICPPGMSAIMNATGAPNEVLLAEMNYGDGLAVFGGLTIPFFGDSQWQPQPDAAQLAFEILAYTANGAAVSGGDSGIVVEDNCDDDVEVVYNGEEIIEGDCPQSYTIVRTWTATDDCDNEAVYTQNITVVDTTAPEFEIFPEDATVECDMIPEVATGATAFDNCDEDVTIEYLGEEIIEGECADSYTIVRTWVASDDCGNETVQSQNITVQDTTAPVFDMVADDVTIECDVELPAPMASATDNCGEVSITNEDVIEETECATEYTLTRTYTATDECGNATTAVQIITVVDTTAPELSGLPEAELVIDCEDDVPAVADVTAFDNCEGDVEVSFTEELIGELPPEGSSAFCNAMTPEAFEDGETCAGTETWSVVLFNFVGEAASYYSTIDASWTEFPDGSAVLTGSVSANNNPDAGWEIAVEFENGMDWDMWSTQGFPTSFKDDCDVAGDEYLDWMYYIMSEGATLTGWGDYEGSVLNLSHAPSNLYYGYQVGVAANNVNANYGGGGWFTYDGIFLGDEVTGSGDFAFDHDCCPQYEIVRTWCATDCAGNETCFTQVISFADLGGEVPGVGYEADEMVDPKGDFQIVKISPNPTNAVSRIEFVANTNNTVRLEVNDMNGRTVAVPFEGNIMAGERYNPVVNTEHLQSGVYMVRLYSLNHVEFKKLVVSK